MRYFLVFFTLLFSFAVFAQEKKIDRSNYELLWEISRNDMEGKAYLFGTYHSNENVVFDFPDALYKALENAESVVLETDVTPFMLKESILIPSNQLGPSDLLDWIIPARTSDDVTYTNYGSDDGRPQFIDLYFKQVADNCDKTFHFLESAEDQLEIGQNNPRNPEAPKNIPLVSRAELKQLYLEGNASDLHKYTRNSTLEYVDLYADLIVNRNIKMAQGIDTLIHQYKSTFIAVGASHLLGEQGIVPLLREKGYTVKVASIHFSEKPTEAELALKKCNQYTYQDTRFSAAINFSGKPAVKELGNADRLVQYQELGQGNTYSLTMYNYGIEVDLNKHIQNHFYDPTLSINSFDSVLLNDNTQAYQGIITTKDNEKEWIRVFSKGNIQYTLAARGGYRFMNSDRPIKFFDSFHFTNLPKKNKLSETVISRSQTLHLKFPEAYFSETKKLKYDDVWEVSWINAPQKEILYAYESIMADNSISYSNEEFGQYIINKFDADSVEVFDYHHINGSHIVKSYSAQFNGIQVSGKIRQIGNIIQHIAYTGNNLKRKEQFLSHFDTLHSFPKIEKEYNLKKDGFQTKISQLDLVEKTPEVEGHDYRNTKAYELLDTQKSIFYHLIVKEFHSWAFSQKSTKELLRSQISWPKDNIIHEVDTIFDLNATHPTMNFALYYPESENRFEGKAILVGKQIVIASLTYPQKAKEQYQNTAFLDSLSFFFNDTTSISKINKPQLKNQIMITDNGKAVSDLIMNGHIGDSMKHAMLNWSPQFWDSFDSKGILQATLLYYMDWTTSEMDLITYWEERANKKNKALTAGILHALQNQKNAEDFMVILNNASKGNILNDADIYKILEINDPKTDFILEVWPVYSALIEDSLAWEMSFKIPDLLKQEFFYNYFASADFVKAITKKTQPPWAAFRYFEIIYEHGIPKKQFSEMLKVWNENPNEHITGSIAAWKTIIDERLSFKEKRLIKKEAAVAISYAKVMAVSETPVYDLLTFEEMIGYIAFDHYKDAYFDKDKSLKHLENRSFYLEEEKMNFAFYKVLENDKVYFMARKLPQNKKLPSYAGFGQDTYFVYGSKKYQPKKMEKELIKLILEGEMKSDK